MRRKKEKTKQIIRNILCLITRHRLQSWWQSSADARAETSSSIDGWTVGQTDRGQRPPYDFCLHIERAPHIIHILTHALNIYYIYIIYLYLFTYVHTRYSLNLLWRVFTSSFCLINKFSIRIIKLYEYVCVHMYLYVHMCVCFSFSILGRRLHVSLIYIKL